MKVVIALAIALCCVLLACSTITRVQGSDNIFSPEKLQKFKSLILRELESKVPQLEQTVVNKIKKKLNVVENGSGASDKDILHVVKRYLYEKGAEKSTKKAIQTVFKFLKKKYGFTQDQVANVQNQILGQEKVGELSDFEWRGTLAHFLYQNALENAKKSPNKLIQKIYNRYGSKITRYSPEQIIKAAEEFNTFIKNGKQIAPLADASEEEVLDFIKRQIYGEVAKQVIKHPLQAIKAVVDYYKKK